MHFETAKKKEENRVHSHEKNISSISALDYVSPIDRTTAHLFSTLE